jgi:nitrate reductase gamma subunit
MSTELLSSAQVFLHKMGFLTSFLSPWLSVVVFCLQYRYKYASEYQNSGGVGAILLVGAVLILLIRTILRRRQHR